MQSEIRILGPADARRFASLRSRSLREHPEAFASSVGEENNVAEILSGARLSATDHRIALGAFSVFEMVGFLVLARSAKAKRMHRAAVESIYVVPEAREQKIAQKLLVAAIEVARAWNVTDVDLRVTVGNTAAEELGAANGFVSYGVEPRSLCVFGHYFDVSCLNLHIGAAIEKRREPQSGGRIVNNPPLRAVTSPNQ